MEYIVVGIFVIGLIVRGFRWLLRKTNPPQTPLAPPPSQAPFPPQNPFQAQTGRMAPPPMTPAQAMQQQAMQQQAMQAQAAQQRAAQQQQARTQARQPSAGGPAVPMETNRQDFVRQEQELFSSEPAGLGVSLSSPPALFDTPANRLFGGTDDLIRAIILQEVLGPPLSRRHSPMAPPPQSEPSQPSPAQ